MVRRHIVVSLIRQYAKEKASSRSQTPFERHSVYAAFAGLADFAGATFFCFAAAFACLAANSVSTAVRTFATSTRCRLAVAARTSVSSDDADSTLPSKTTSTMSLDRPAMSASTR